MAPPNIINTLNCLLPLISGVSLETALTETSSRANAVFKPVPSESWWQRAQTEAEEDPAEPEEELLPSEGDGAQAAQGGCGVSFSGDIPAPPGQGPLQPTVGDPAWAGGWAGGSPEVPSNPDHSGIL